MLHVGNKLCMMKTVSDEHKMVGKYIQNSKYRHICQVAGKQTCNFLFFVRDAPMAFLIKHFSELSVVASD